MNQHRYFHQEQEITYDGKPAIVKEVWKTFIVISQVGNNKIEVKTVSKDNPKITV